MALVLTGDGMPVRMRSSRPESSRRFESVVDQDHGPDRPRPEEVAESEATYRLALAELREFETGVRPHWAPRKQEPSEPEPANGQDSENGASETEEP